MLDILGGRYGLCDGLSRRGFLRVGALGIGALTLPDLLRSRAAAGPSARDTAVIQVFLQGGPTHIDTYDMKPDAPKEFRGEFNPIKTSLPGVEICEHLPRQARVMDKMALIRSLYHDSPDHNVGSHWVMTGFPSNQQFSFTNDRPSAGSIAAKLRGPNGPGVPPYVAIPNSAQFGNAAYLGPGFNPFSVGGDNNGNFNVRNLKPPGGLTLDRLEDRRHLLSQLDRLNHQRDLSGAMDGLDQFTAKAYEMITGPAARKAFDLSKEDPRLRDRYGRNQFGQGCLLARRLIEAGVTFVTINTDSNWDHHGQLFQLCKQQLPPLDAAVATLVEDLYSRGLSERVLVLLWGEFGRSPRINGNGGGREHWPNAMFALLAGGGLRMGQVIGATNRKGESPSERPLRPEDVLQTVYHILGVDPTASFLNEAGRPMPVLNVGNPISELIA
jgi:hypothetical protein